MLKTPVTLVFTNKKRLSQYKRQPLLKKLVLFNHLVLDLEQN